MRNCMLCCVLLLPLSGCCSFARLFCGPDRTPWVSVDYATPEQAVRTLLEALRRDEPEIVYLSLSDDYRARLGVDAWTTQLAWPRIVAANPGLHVAGYASVPAAVRLGADRAAVALSIEGRRLDVQLVRQAKWEVRWRRDDGTPAEPGAPLSSFAGYLRSEADPHDDDFTLVTIAPLRIPSGRDGVVSLDAIEAAGLSRSWKIADLRLLQP